MSAATAPARVELTPKVLAVCAEHYGNCGTGCGKCPVRVECHGAKGLTGRLTDDSLRDWQQRLNDAAEKVEL